LEVLTGTATSGATLANRTGAAALPNDCLRLADLLIPALSTTISNTQIRDRRPWARGAHTFIQRVANAAAGSDYTTASTTLVVVDSTNLRVRIECSGVPLRVILQGEGTTDTAGSGMLTSVFVDGATIGSFVDLTKLVSPSLGQDYFAGFVYTFTPSAGSHLLEPAYARAGGAGSAILRANSTTPLVWQVEEIVRQNTANNTTTSG
jgi:hypothetical protein